MIVTLPVVMSPAIAMGRIESTRNQHKLSIEQLSKSARVVPAQHRLAMHASQNWRTTRKLISTRFECMPDGSDAHSSPSSSAVPDRHTGYSSNQDSDQQMAISTGERTELKQRLTAAAGSSNGLDRNPEQRAEIKELVEALEARNPSPEPAGRFT